MGKKSRRQRTKNPDTVRDIGLRKVVRGALTANTPLSNLSDQELRKLANEVLDSQDPTRADDDDDDDDSELDAIQEAAPAASKPTVAAAEAEFRAAMAAIPPSRDSNAVEVFQHPRCVRAIQDLMGAVTLDEDDKQNFTAYLSSHRGRGNMGGEELIKLMKRWLRIRNYWPRVRRRICWGCGKEYDLSEPRLWVCGGCGEARYCDEACQAAHWPKHKTPCLKTFHEKTKKSLSRGVSVGKLRQAYLEAYHDDGAARVFSAMDKK